MNYNYLYLALCGWTIPCVGMCIPCSKSLSLKIIFWDHAEKATTPRMAFTPLVEYDGRNLYIYPEMSPQNLVIKILRDKQVVLTYSVSVTNSVYSIELPLTLQGIYTIQVEEDGNLYEGTLTIENTK